VADISAHLHVEPASRGIPPMYRPPVSVNRAPAWRSRVDPDEISAKRSADQRFCEIPSKYRRTPS
jgi:hypothetical protein